MNFCDHLSHLLLLVERERAPVDRARLLSGNAPKATPEGEERSFPEEANRAPLFIRTYIFRCSRSYIIRCSLTLFALTMVRKELWAQEEQTFCGSPSAIDTIKVPRAFVERLTEAVCYAA